MFNLELTYSATYRLNIGVTLKITIPLLSCSFCIDRTHKIRDNHLPGD